MRILALALFITVLAAGQTINGSVVDAATGERLARVKVTLAGKESTTDSEGRFSFESLSTGDNVLSVSTVGYRPVRETITVTPGESRDLQILLNPELLRQRDSVDVAAGPFATEAPGAVSLSGNELRNLASVIMDDPLRSVQGLPGVVSGDDFQSQMSVRAAAYERVGLYLDGILLHQPFHSVQGDQTSASITILNGDVLDGINFHAVPPSAFFERTGAAIDARSRDGNRERIKARLTLSMSNLAGVVEGPIGKQKRGSWMVSARKSYLQYLINLVSDQNGLGFAFSDVTAKATYDLTPKHNLSATFLHGFSELDRTGNPNLGLNAAQTSGYHVTLASLAWRWAPSSTFLFTNRAAFLRESFANRNREPVVLSRGGYYEWIGGGDGTWLWNPRSNLNFGWTARRPRGEGFEDRRVAIPVGFVRLSSHRGTAMRTGGHVVPTWTLLGGRVTMSGGGRIDHASNVNATAVSPTASVGLRITGSTRLNLTWTQTVQYPEIAQAFLGSGTPASQPRLLPERSIHLNVALDQRLSERTRLRMEWFNRTDRDLLSRPLLEPRLLQDGTVFIPPIQPLFTNSARGYARGGQVFLQSRTANGLTGWVSYAFTASRVCDGILQVCYAADYEQRHTVNVYGSYRWRPTVNFSARWIYGSGTPLRGFFRADTPQEIFLSTQKNQLRMPEYSRLDFRANKTFSRDRWRYTLFAEVINLLNHDNYRVDNLTNFTPATARARPTLEETFPILPSAGLLIEF